MRGHIYFIGDGSYYKVGFTYSTVQKRLTNLQVGSSKELYIVKDYIVREPEEVERQVHFDLRRFALRGEWFSLTSEELEAYLRAFEETHLLLYGE